MIIKTRGIIFKAIKYSETSMIVDIYTEEKGLRKYIISGVRSKRAKVSASLLQAMTLVDLVVYHREDREMTRIKEIRPAFIFQTIPFDIQRGAVGLFMIEVAQKAIRESEENYHLFQFLFESFAYLDRTEDSIANLHIHFLLELTTFLGFMPGEICSEEQPYFNLKDGVFVTYAPTHRHYLSKEDSAVLYQLLETAQRNCHQVRMNREMRKSLLKNLLIYYQLHIENFPTINSHTILQEVME
ncbi:MAG: DNA repair protein RecO [Saprospiraceae bacterium]